MSERQAGRREGHIVDAAERARAIDPGGSYCVSAPAGSGKTELLIQRYLSLLPRVERPEQVLAITFTRKAAAEMRDRVLQALAQARAGTPCDSDHQRTTRALAQAALAADGAGGWHLLRDVSRLNIKTIDSFCAALTRQMPVLSEFGGQASPEDDTRVLYAEAVEELFALLDTDHPVAGDLAALLRHVDNNWPRLQELLVALLGQRQQWRDYIGVHREAEAAEAYLVHAVTGLVREELAGLVTLLAPEQAELLRLWRFASGNLELREPPGFPGTDPADLPWWRELRQFLLTNGGTWRKRLTKAEGFPGGGGDNAARKEAMQALLLRLARVEGLETALHGVKLLPQMAAGSTSWQLVLHLSRLLPVLAAQLLLVFRRHGVVDHNQVAQSALQALGDDDAPTELALRLDYRIEHILVDEFQDTSVTQYELLHKLTRGWAEQNTANPGRPRTLMIVGDPMQSIYGFRGGNVGLFLRARQQGFNDVLPQHLQLRCNFRSAAGVVDWVNDTFQQAFPAQDDIGRSRVRYRPAVAVRGATGNPAVAADAFTGDTAAEAELAFVCRNVLDHVRDGGGSVAVLGRSRPQLRPILRRLRQLGVACNAPDMDNLASSAVVADLMSLCRALACDADRLAWFALLRAPWCGLTLADLLALAPEPLQPLRRVIADPVARARLSADGRERLERVAKVMQAAHGARDRLGLRVWVEQTWTGLGGHLCATSEGELEDAESFLQLLEQAEADGFGLDLAWLQRQLESSSVSAGDPDSPVQVMTLHKAKGLEFERVIIPGLAAQVRSDRRELLLWDEHGSASGQRSFLLAANDQGDADEPSLYNYLFAQHREKQLLERTRLLYVGCTRAVRHLQLTACLNWDGKKEQWQPPAAASLLAPVWTQFAAAMQVHADEPVAAPAPAAAQSSRPLWRLPVAVLPASADFAAQPASGGNLPEMPSNHRERAVGTVIHLALENLSRRRPLPPAATAADQHLWRLALVELGLSGEDLARALARVEEDVDRTLAAGSRGRWLLDADHPEARSEWPLTVLDGDGASRNLVIDRSFVDGDSGIRWLVDYKSSAPEPGEAMDHFLRREAGTYREQLLVYRRALDALYPGPLRCALYFTALDCLHTLDALDEPDAPVGEYAP